MSVIKENSQLHLLGKFVFKKGSVYKQDCLLTAMRITGNKSDGGKLLRELIKREIVYLTDFTLGKQRREKRTVSIVQLTELGVSVLSKIDEELDSAQYRRIQALSQTSSHERLVRLYNQNHIQTLFDAADIPTSPLDKPSLSQLYAHINQTAYHHDDDSLYPYFQEEDLDEAYTKGIYYSDAEYTRFFNTEMGGPEILSSIFRGLFISRDKCLVIYSNGKNNPRMLYLKTEASETLLMRNLKAQGFARTRIVASGLERKKLSLSALLVSDVNSFIYSTAIGRRAGRVNPKSPKTLKTKSIVFSGDTGFVQDDAEIGYSAVYCIAYGHTGIRNLQYLVSHSLEDHLEESRFLADINQKFSIRQSVTMPLHYRFRDVDYPAVYMPVYELKTLNAIRKLDYTPVIVTYPDMTDVIQHCTHHQHIFIDADTLKPMSSNHTAIYDELGFLKGKRMLEDYLHSTGQTITYQQFRQLPALYDMEYNEFYNLIAQGRLKPEDITTELTTKPYVDKIYYRQRKAHIYIPRKLYQQMKAYADRHNVTLYTASIRFFRDPDLSFAIE